MKKPQLYSGKGSVKIAEVDEFGRPKAYQRVGNVTSATLSNTIAETEHKEMESGQNAIDDILIDERKSELKAVCENFEASLLAIVMQGVLEESPGESVLDEVLTSGLVAGDYIALAGVNVSALSIEDSAGTALVEGVHYELDSAEHGAIQIRTVNLTEATTAPAAPAVPFVQPFKASYTSGKSRSFGVMENDSKEYAIRFEGLNMAKNGKKVLIDFFISLNPADTFELIQTAGFGSFTLAGKLLWRKIGGKFRYARVQEL